MGQIPKTVHLSWKTKDLLQSQSPIVLNGVRRLADLNPDWEIQISTDEEVDQYLKEKLEPQDYRLIADIGVVPQTDIWRLIKMYFEGGLYVDVDRFWNIRLDEILEEDTKQIIPTNRDHDFSHDFMLSAPGSPVFAAAIDLYFKRRKAGHNAVFFLGPQTYMHAITYAVFGEMIDCNPGQKMFEKMRMYLDSYEYMRTFREDGPYETVCYHHDPDEFKSDDTGTQDWETLKRKFYANNGIKHWTGEW
jgi:hypothetical protein